MKYCGNCGAQLNDDDRFCDQCGAPQEMINDKKEENQIDLFSEMVNKEAEKAEDFGSKTSEKAEDFGSKTSEKAEDFGDKTSEKAEDFGNKISEKAEDLGNKALEKAGILGNIAKEKASIFGAKAKVELQDQLEKQKEKQIAAEEKRKQEAELIAQKKKEAEERLAASETVTSQTELWSWLKKSSQRKHFYTDEINTLTEDDFAEKVQEKITANSVPARIEKRQIEWDRAGIMDTIYSIIPETSVANPMTCILLFKHIGKFSFVEEKTFIAPPDLPDPPEKKWPLDAGASGRVIFLFIGLILCGLGLGSLSYGQVGLAMLGIGAVLLVVGVLAFSKVNSINDHNKMVDLQEKAWNKAWNDWKNNIFKHAFQEDINGHLSRIFDSVFECITQVCNEEFKGKAAGEQEESSSLANLEELIQRRQDDYR